METVGEAPLANALMFTLRETGGLRDEKKEEEAKGERTKEQHEEGDNRQSERQRRKRRSGENPSSVNTHLIICNGHN